MAAETDPPVRYIDSITERYARLGYAPYRWYRAEDAPAFARLTKPLSQSRLGVLSTSGCYVAGQVAFHYKDDTSVRLIPRDTAPENLRFSHITENYLRNPRKDSQCIFPSVALNRALDDGRIGGLGDDFISCMGGIYSQRRVREELIPTVAEIFASQEVDVALLVPM